MTLNSYNDIYSIVKTKRLKNDYFFRFLSKLSIIATVTAPI